MKKMMIVLAALASLAAFADEAMHESAVKETNDGTTHKVEKKMTHKDGKGGKKMHKEKTETTAPSHEAPAAEPAKTN